jgi:hypothetical protein
LFSEYQECLLRILGVFFILGHVTHMNVLHNTCV